MDNEKEPITTNKNAICGMLYHAVGQARASKSKIELTPKETEVIISIIEEGMRQCGCPDCYSLHNGKCENAITPKPDDSALVVGISQMIDEYAYNAYARGMVKDSTDTARRILSLINKEG